MADVRQVAKEPAIRDALERRRTNPVHLQDRSTPIEVDACVRNQVSLRRCESSAGSRALIIVDCRKSAQYLERMSRNDILG